MNLLISRMPNDSKFSTFLLMVYCWNLTTKNCRKKVHNLFASHHLVVFVLVKIICKCHAYPEYLHKGILAGITSSYV